MPFCVRFGITAVGQLLGYLAYDVVLNVPFLQHLAVVDPTHRVNLIINIGVILFSAGLALFYLFINLQPVLSVPAIARK